MYREPDHCTLAFSFCRKFLAFSVCKSDLQVSKRHFQFAKVICRSAKGIFRLQKRFAGQQKAFSVCKSDLQVSKRHFPFAKAICRSAKDISTLQKGNAGLHSGLAGCFATSQRETHDVLSNMWLTISSLT